MLLDFLDALAGAVTIAWWWCTWVRPYAAPRPHPALSEAPDIERFLLEVRTCPACRRLVP